MPCRPHDKEWANSLVWLDRVESSPPQLSGGNICVLANERCLFCSGSNRPLAAVRGDSLCHGPGMERGDRDGGEEREGGCNPCIQSLLRKQKRSAFYNLGCSSFSGPEISDSVDYTLAVCSSAFKGIIAEIMKHFKLTLTVKTTIFVLILKTSKALKKKTGSTVQSKLQGTDFKFNF